MTATPRKKRSAIAAAPVKPAKKVRSARAAAPTLSGCFAALDFETADYGRDSACALSVVLVQDQQIVETWTSLIRPPRQNFVFTYLHGIAWQHVRNKPTFGELWPEVARRLAKVDFIAAHNAAFDRSVLRACCDMAGQAEVPHPFLCTVKLARAIWNLHPAKLSDVARHLQIPLRHHDAASDAHACAQILLHAGKQGHPYPELYRQHVLKPARR